jgi:RNA-directed DNA polymerase
LHRQKTKVVYCKDANRPGEYPERSFDFLGYTFRPRVARNHYGKRFVGFIPAVGKRPARQCDSACAVGDGIAAATLNGKTSANGANGFAPSSGWVRYYGRFYPSKLRGELRTIDPFGVRWASRKDKRFQGHTMATWAWLRALQRRNPSRFAHWMLGATA